MYTFVKIALPVGILFLFSCKKNYNCYCVQTVVIPGYEYMGETHPQETSVNSFSNTFKSKRKNAESTCKSSERVRTYSSSYEAYGQGPTVETISCELH